MPFILRGNTILRRRKHGDTSAFIRPRIDTARRAARQDLPIIVVVFRGACARQHTAAQRTPRPAAHSTREEGRNCRARENGALGVCRVCVRCAVLCVCLCAVCVRVLCVRVRVACVCVPGGKGGTPC